MTFGALVKSATAAIILVASGLVLLDIWGVDVTPEVWSAGIVTAGLAFGAQSVVRDVLAGLMFLFEDVYEIGDSVEITTTTNAVVGGAIESLGLRVTVLTDDAGRRIFIPNGNILMVANASRLPYVASFTLTLPLIDDVAQLRAKLANVVAEAATAAGVSGAPKIRFEDVGVAGVTFRVEMPVAGADAVAMRAQVRERVATAAQGLGWFPGAARDAGAGAQPRATPLPNA
jgi:moderate conductance mechanosensitive channel